MKRFVLLIFIVTPFICLKAATTYYSHGSLDPGQLSSWGTTMIGGTPPLSFTAAGDVFIIQSGHNMTTTATWTIGSSTSTLQIQSGGTLTGSKLIILTGTFQIDNGGTYIHNNAGAVGQGPGSSIFSGTESFGPSSNFEIRNWFDPTTPLPNNLPGIIWGNLIINLQVTLPFPWNFSINSGETLTIMGNLDIRSTGIPVAKELRLTGSGTQTINVGGSFLISGSNSYVAIKKNSSTLTGLTTMQVNGDVSVSSTCTLEITGNSATAGNGCILKFKGNLNNAGTLSTNGVFGTTNDLELNGTTNQSVTVNTITGAFSGTTLAFNMNNAAGATLLTPVTLSGNLGLISGNITTTSTNILTMVRNAVNTVASNASFVNGPLKKIGDELFTFPVGQGNEYAPIQISGGGAMNDIFIAQYFRGDPRAIIGSNFETATIHHMSRLEWWTLDRAIGISSKYITLFARGYTDATLLSDLRILRWDGSLWVNEGQLSSTGVATGPVTSQAVSSFSALGPTPFTFGSVTAGENPLPINLISFDAIKLSNTRLSVNWELAACCSSAAKFEVQRAGADKSFTTIGTVGGSATNPSYTYTDNDLQTGINYYRLKTTDESGTVTYTRIVVIMNGVKGLLLTSLSPTIISNTASLNIASSSSQKLDIIITDMQGRLVMKQTHTVNEGDTNIQLSLDKLAAGLYQLTGVSAGGKTNTIRFIRN